MCGVCGIVTFDNLGATNEPMVKRMCRTMVHRGPDDEGYYTSQHVYLGMRRLSIIDLITGQQPITNEDQTVWVVFNGEIYNYREIRARLEKNGHRFATQSDTEVIVHAYEEYGQRCVEHFNGMFAFAIWDERHQRLFLARDRLGIKPLYYWANGRHIIFASELKAILVHPAVPREIDLIALDQFLTLEYIPAPRTILEHVKKLPAGHKLVFEGGDPKAEAYWDVPFQRPPQDEASCREILAELIQDAVRLRLVSDVPLGAFLSGGIDSSTIVACMFQAATEPVKTFSIAFDDATYDETPYAQAVANYFKTEHHEEILDPQIAPLAEQMVNYLDEPFADSSVFPTYLVSKLASQTVRVVLSGDGGDELFGGYDAYVAQKFDRLYRWLPAPLRQRALPTLLDRVPPRSAKKGLINKSKRFVEGAALPADWQHTRWMMFMHWADKAELYRPDVLAGLNGHMADLVFSQYFKQAASWDPLAQQQYVDLKTYLAEDILTKVDRMSMAASIEARVPLLDYRIVEFALNLPAHMKLHRKQTKVILRKIMRGRLPDAVLNRSKEGFSIPLKHWLRGPLRPLMTDLLSSQCVRHRGYFQPQTVERWLREHLEGRVNHSHRLWALMVFELWYRNVQETRAALV